MRKFSDVVQDQFGNGLAGASVQVNISGGGAATLFSDQGSTTITNPMTTDAQGRFSCYLVDGRYDFVISGAGITSNTQSDIEVSDIVGNLSTFDTSAHFNRVGIGTNTPGTSTSLQVAGLGLFTGGVSDPGDGTPAGVNIGYNGTTGFVQAVQTGIVTKTLALNPAGGVVNIGSVSGFATGGMAADGGGFKHKRVSFTPTNGTVDVSVAWTTVFADANYTAVVLVENGSADTTGWQEIGRTASTLTIRVTGTGTHPGAGTLHAIAVHD